MVFFSGHGLLKAPGAEIWLLSGAPGNPNEAVNVAGSMAGARYCGIEHVIFISDACRSNPPSVQFSAITGSQIFPNQSPNAISPEVDVFYATRPGDPALEIPPDDASSEYRGIFSECLVEALSGSVPKIIVTLPGNPVSRVIPSRPLKKHLLVAVPDAVAAVSIKLRQAPEIRVESDLPKYLADVTGITSAILPAGPDLNLPGPKAFPPPDALGDYEAIFQANFLLPRQSGLDALPGAVTPEMLERIISAVPYRADRGRRQETRAQDAIDRLLATKGRETFETRTGFSVVGAGIKHAVLLSGTCDVFPEKNAMHVRVQDDHVVTNGVIQFEPNVALIRFEDGTGTGLAVLPGFVASVVVEDARIVTINYTPARGTDKYSEYESHAKVVDQRRAFAAVAARNGIFRLDAKEANNAADYIRLAKSLDPTLGMYAAYAYMQAGNRDGIQSVFRIMSDDVEPVFFDIAMLSHYMGPWPEAKHFPPFFPMMAQGWSYLSGIKASMPRAALDASKHLVPALWTTFSSKGMDILETAFLSKERHRNFF